MDRITIKKAAMLVGAALGIWIAGRYLLPVSLPFLLGGLLALASEPAVALAQRRMKRSWACGIGVSVTLVLLLCIVTFIGALVVRELGIVTQRLPDMQKTAEAGLGQVRRWLSNAADKAPESLRGLIRQTLNSTFTDSSALVSGITRQLPGAVTGVLSWIPKSALAVFTALLSGFMISARLPRLRQKLSGQMPEKWQRQYLPALRQLRQGLTGWLKAQLKLMGLTWGIVGLGLLLLRVEHGLLWAGLIALVDAVPVLGTGTVMIPWALFRLLQGDYVFAAGLLGIYVVALTLRTVLEPRLIGRQLGLDPLVTLAAFYAGFSLFGIGGMLLAPILAAAVSSVLRARKL